MFVPSLCKSSACCRFSSSLAPKLQPVSIISHQTKKKQINSSAVVNSGCQISQPEDIPTYLHCILPLREMCRLLLLLLRHDRRLMLAQPPPDSPSLLGAQVEGKIFLLRVEEA